MLLLQWYRRYRAWAHAGGSAEGLALIATVIHAIVFVCGLLAWHSGLGWHWPGWRWVVLAFGLVAAIDAWGAAMYRGLPSEAWLRGLVVFGACGLLPWCLLP